ncbi:MAG: glycosyltransferase [Nitrospiraceae bacterium]|nr:glycosyltransferase [Nitrospiraceae bacterium]
MRVFFVSSEIYPFAKTGGLADVSYALPKALSEFGVSVCSVMPLYRCIDVKKHKIASTGKRVKVEIGAGTFEFEVYKVQNSVTNYFLKNDYLFGREYLYGMPKGDYRDNDIRFGAFCWAVSKLIKEGFFKPDIVHVNDWQTSLIPVILKKRLNLNIKTLLTIHNLAYQGVFSRESIDRLSLGWELFHMEALEFWGKVNFLKGGIVFSDAVNTVSPTYAREITTPQFGFGLDGVLRKYSYKLFGIINGTDYDVWNPETDPYIYVNYTESSIENKELNKKRFIEERGLKGEEFPLFSFIGRLAKQKGVDLILDSFNELSKVRANFAMLGTGDKYYNEAFMSAKERYPNIFIDVTYDESMSRKMYASSDFLLIPSLYEPCGLNQMIAMAYGTIVLARETGGLVDTVRDVEEPDGYGFLFERFKKEDFLKTIDRAVKFFTESRGSLIGLKRFVMGMDFSWNSSAFKYLRLYENLIEGKVNES